MNRTFIIPILISVMLGSLIGKFMVDQYKQNEMVFNEQNKVFVLQQGIYESEDEYNEATANIPFKVLVVEENSFLCYVAMTQNENNIDKIRNYFTNLGVEVYLKEIIVSNYEFINNLSQYDILLSISDTDEEIKSIMQTIISSYNEMVVNNE